MNDDAKKYNSTTTKKLGRLGLRVCYNFKKIFSLSNESVNEKIKKKNYFSVNNV